MRLTDDDLGDDSQYHGSQFHFEDGGMRGLAGGLVWCGLLYFCADLPDQDLCTPGVKDLVRSLLSIPTFFKRPGEDPARSMIQRIIRQNVESKKLAVSSFEWSQILSSLTASGEKITVQDAIDLYNQSPEVVAHGSGTGKDRLRLRFQHLILQEAMFFVLGDCLAGQDRDGHAVVGLEEAVRHQALAHHDLKIRKGASPACSCGLSISTWTMGRTAECDALSLHELNFGLRDTSRLYHDSGGWRGKYSFELVIANE